MRLAQASIGNLPRELKFLWCEISWRTQPTHERYPSEAAASTLHLVQPPGFLEISGFHVGAN
jgi:hypothetical protein